MRLTGKFIFIFASPIDKVYQALTTDYGRSKYWAEQTKEEEGMIEFIILNYPLLLFI
jgi:uncharacterized protein YndB with AHSA1/START domain